MLYWNCVIVFYAVHVILCYGILCHVMFGCRYIPNVEIVFIIMGVIGIVTGLYLNYYDYYFCGSVLNRGAVAAAAAAEGIDNTNTTQQQNDDNLVKRPLVRNVNGFDTSDHDSGSIEQGLFASQVGIYSPAPPTSEAHILASNQRSTLGSSHGNSRSNSRSNSRTRSNGGEHEEHNNRAARRSRGSFTAHEEILYGGAFDHVQKQ